MTESHWRKQREIVEQRIDRCREEGASELYLDIELSDNHFAEEVISLVTNHVPTIKTLRLSNTLLDDTGLAALAAQAQHFPNLQSLYLSDTKVGDTGLAALAAQAQHFPNLQSLYLSDTKVGDTGLEALAAQAQHFPNLQMLDLMITQVGDTGLVALAAQAQHFPNLDTLLLANTQVGDMSLAALAAQARHFSNLQALELSCTQVGDKGVIVLARQAKHLSRLNMLGLDGTQVGDEGLIALAVQAQHLSNFCMLELSNTQVGDKGLIALASRAQYLSRLATVELNNTQVGDKGLIALAAQAQHLANVASVELNNTQVGDKGLIAFAAQAQHLSNLQRLELNDTRVGDEGLITLAAQAQHFSNLSTLMLNNTQVGDEGLAALAAQAHHLPNLEHLDLNGTQVTVVKEILNTYSPRAIFKALSGLPTAEAQLGEPSVGKQPRVESTVWAKKSTSDDPTQQELIGRPPDQETPSSESQHSPRLEQVRPVESDHDPNQSNQTVSNVAPPRGRYKKLLKIKEKVDPKGEYIGESIRILEVFELIHKYHNLREAILLGGESGSGKSKIAKLIHDSTGRNGKYARVQGSNLRGDPNLASTILFGASGGVGLPNMRKEGKRGLLEECAGGTIFIDEVHAVPVDMQIKLHDVLDDNPVTKVGGGSFQPDVRLIFATNEDMQELIDEGAMRRDFYNRMCEWKIFIPPLRERKEDIFLFVERLVIKDDYDVDPFVYLALLAHDWPANVRDLIYTLKKAKTNANSKRITLQCLELPEQILNKFNQMNHRDAERTLCVRLKETLENQGWGKGVQKRIAELLGKSDTTVSRWLKPRNDET